MARKLTDLEIEKVSLVSKRARPVNKKSIITFIKSQEGGKDMSIKSFLEKYMPEKKDSEVTKSEEEVVTVTPEQEFVTKAEFAELSGQISTMLNEMKEMKEGVQKASFGEFAKDFVDAFKVEQDNMRKEIAQEIAKAKRAYSPVQNQPSLEDLIKSYENPEHLFNFQSGNAVNSIIDEGVKKGTLKLNSVPKEKNSFNEAFRMMNGIQ